MSGKRSKQKGAGGEREFFLLARRVLDGALDEHLLQRNLAQTQEGGYDARGLVFGYAIEIKRTKGWQLNYWRQAQRQARIARAKPALAFRQDRNRWQVTVCAGDVGLFTASGVVTFEAVDWLLWVKECLDRV